MVFSLLERRHGLCRSGEVLPHVLTQGGCFALAHLLAFVVPKRIAQGLGFSLQGFALTFQRVGSVGVTVLHIKAARTFNQRASRRMVAYTFNNAIISSRVRRDPITHCSEKTSCQYLSDLLWRLGCSWLEQRLNRIPLHAIIKFARNVRLLRARLVLLLSHLLVTTPFNGRSPSALDRVF